MAHAFKVIPAKPTFGTLKQVVYQSDYLKNKKSKRTYCTSQASCAKIKNADSYDQVNLYKEGFRLNNMRNCNILPFNKSDLIVNLYSKMNLKYACPFINGFPCINPDLTDENCTGLTNPACCSDACNGDKTLTVTVPATTFNWSHTIDPVGDLFGKTQCGTEKYTQYMVFNPPNGITLQNS